MHELSVNKFLKKHYQMKNESLLDNVDSFRHPFPLCLISFFLQTHTTQQHQEFMKKRDVAISNFINSIKRKLPDRIDIFNKKNEAQFVTMMKGDFKRII